MMDSKELQNLTPKTYISYRIRKGTITPGNFEQIPENAHGALIHTLFPVVDANGNFKLTTYSYNLFVGESFSVEEILNTLNKKNRLIKLNEKHYSK